MRSGYNGLTKSGVELLQATVELARVDEAFQIELFLALVRAGAVDIPLPPSLPPARTIAIEWDFPCRQAAQVVAVNFKSTSPVALSST